MTCIIFTVNQGISQFLWWVCAFFNLRWGGSECTPPPTTTRQMILSWRPWLKHCLCFYPLLWQQWQLSIKTQTWWTIYIHSFHLFTGRETHTFAYIYLYSCFHDLTVWTVYGNEDGRTRFVFIYFPLFGSSKKQTAVKVTFEDNLLKAICFFTQIHLLAGKAVIFSLQTPG